MMAPNRRYELSTEFRTPSVPWPVVTLAHVAIRLRGIVKLTHHELSQPQYMGN